MTTQDFTNFGYLVPDPCCVCGKRPARQEPRFSYVVCIVHAELSPVAISEYMNMTKLPYRKEDIEKFNQIPSTPKQAL